VTFTVNPVAVRTGAENVGVKATCKTLAVGALVLAIVVKPDFEPITVAVKDAPRSIADRA
jgi:hypothetical protein